jgi:hypothetical protein
MKYISKSSSTTYVIFEADDVYLKTVKHIKINLETMGFGNINTK